MAFTYNKGQLKISDDPNHPSHVWCKENKENIIQLYREHKSVKYIMEETDLFSSSNRPLWGHYTSKVNYIDRPISLSTLRPYVEYLLINENEYLSHADSVRYTSSRRMKNLEDKYGKGIINPSQIPTTKGEQAGNGWCKMNNLPLNKIMFYDDFREYREKVDKLTKTNRQKLLRGTFPDYEDYELPKYCQLTGIKFVDADGERVNPNDFLKRSLDHKKPVLLSFLDGDTPEQCSHPNNFVWILKQCNSVKGNTSFEDFKENFAPKIRRLLINEGYEHN